MEVSSNITERNWTTFSIFPLLICRYVSEINMPDNLALYSQLGASPPLETWHMPTDDCHQLFDWDSGHINPALVPTPMRRK